MSGTAAGTIVLHTTWPSGMTAVREVLAYVGSSGVASSAAAVDGARARRQAGSTLKPFLYGLAFERRYLTPVSVLDDSPLNLETGTGLYVPQNYDRQFAGLVSARTALASSLNIPAVRTLILVGVEAFRERLQSLGYEAVDQDGRCDSTCSLARRTKSRAGDDHPSTQLQG